MSYSFKGNSVPFVLERLSNNRNLSDWEKGFIKSVKEHSDNGGFLSVNQLQKLSDIWEKY